MCFTGGRRSLKKKGKLFQNHISISNGRGFTEAIQLIWIV